MWPTAYYYCVKLITICLRVQEVKLTAGLHFEKLKTRKIQVDDYEKYYEFSRSTCTRAGRLSKVAMGLKEFNADTRLVFMWRGGENSHTFLMRITFEENISTSGRSKY